MPLSKRARRALKNIDRIDLPQFKNDCPDDLRAILNAGTLKGMREIGRVTNNELCQILGEDKNDDKLW